MFLFDLIIIHKKQCVLWKNFPIRVGIVKLEINLNLDIILAKNPNFLNSTFIFNIIWNISDLICNELGIFLLFANSLTPLSHGEAALVGRHVIYINLTHELSLSEFVFI